MRYFLFSAIVHLLIVIAGLSLFKDNINFEMVGDPTIAFSMVGESSEASGFTTDMVTGRPQNTSSEPEKKAPEPVKEEIEPVEEPEEVIEDIIEEPIEEPIPEEEKETPEEVVEEIIETPEEVVETEETEEISEETSDVETTNDSENTTDELSDETNDTNQNSDGSETLGEGLVQLDDGTIAAKNQGVKGLSYGFIRQPEPSYPSIARRMGVREDVVVKARFLIGYDGRVEKVDFYDDVENFGFREEVEKALRDWRATPIEVNGQKVKLYFYKAFKFERIS